MNMHVHMHIKSNMVVRICDRAYENQPSGRIKIALFFQLRPFITPDMFEITTQVFYHTCRI